MLNCALALRLSTKQHTYKNSLFTRYPKVERHLRTLEFTFISALETSLQKHLQLVLHELLSQR